MYGHTDNNEMDAMPMGMDNAELMRTVASLRQDVTDITSDIREVLRENAELKKEVGRLRGAPKKNSPVSEIARLKQEIDQMIHLHGKTQAGRQPLPSRPKREDHHEEPTAGGNAWMKKMMMVMMMADLV